MPSKSWSRRVCKTVMVHFKKTTLRQLTLIFTLIVSTTFTACGQTECNKAKLNAQTDFEEGNYFFHSLEFQPIENTYLFVLREDYNIQWRFIDQDSLDYYNCYDSALTLNLKKKYGDDFLNNATIKADSLERTENWRKEPEFPGGNAAMFKFIWDRLKIEQGDLGDRIQTKIFISFTITEKGELEEIKVLKGISEKVDNKVVQIFKEMPNWSPAYLYGKPTRMRYSLPIQLEFR
jgi:hypothetical protein